jgi:hypothetical protein
MEFLYCVFIKPYQNLFSKQKLIAHPCAKAPLCEAQSFSKGKGRNVRIQMRTRFCETILREGGFAKPRLIFLKFSGVLVSAPQESAGGMRGVFLFGFLARRASKQKILPTQKSFLT